MEGRESVRGNKTACRSNRMEWLEARHWYDPRGGDLL